MGRVRTAYVVFLPFSMVFPLHLARRIRIVRQRGKARRKMKVQKAGGKQKIGEGGLLVSESEQMNGFCVISWSCGVELSARRFVLQRRFRCTPGEWHRQN